MLNYEVLEKNVYTGPVGQDSGHAGNDALLSILRVADRADIVFAIITNRAYNVESCRIRREGTGICHIIWSIRNKGRRPNPNFFSSSYCRQNDVFVSMPGDVRADNEMGRSSV